jgi:hypothetical protein
MRCGGYAEQRLPNPPSLRPYPSYWAGRIPDQWRLFSPAYVKAYIDKYGYGQRTLSLFSVTDSVSSADSHAKYTARLRLSPPRSVMYSVDGFPMPPHASFRNTTVQTRWSKHKKA